MDEIQTERDQRGYFQLEKTEAGRQQYFPIISAMTGIFEIGR